MLSSSRFQTGENGNEQIRAGEVVSNGNGEKIEQKKGVESETSVLRYAYRPSSPAHLRIKVSVDQRGRLMMSTERLNKSSDRVRDNRRTMLETEELGVSLLQDLHQQQQSLLHAHGTIRFYTLLNHTLFHK
ncbi:hypothetical protein HanRHA438_Chr16g0777141 [Helianthus annuus]|nr:hypothetical protein HanRHA438_Chr16g0777141 [Helianthus annuus]